VTLVLHTTGASSLLIPEVRRVIQSLDSHLPVQEIKTVEEIVGLQLWPARTLAGLVTGLGLLGLFLAAVGIYGVMSYAVAQRTREIGIRMALGAQTGDVLRLVVRHGLRLILLGTVIGLSLALAVTRWLASLLYGVSAHDPFTFLGVPLLLAATALLAAYLPARRATKVDPLTALRHD
jgi:putative ABC transport system permease protein